VAFGDYDDAAEAAVLGLVPAVVIKDVPSNSTVVGVPGRIVKQEGKEFPGMRLDHTNLPDPLAQALDKLQDEINHIEGEMKKHSEGLKK